MIFRSSKQGILMQKGRMLNIRFRINSFLKFFKKDIKLYNDDDYIMYKESSKK